MTQNYDNLKQEFLSKFKDDVAPKLEEYEEMRITEANSEKRANIISIIFAVLCPIVFFGALRVFGFNIHIFYIFTASFLFYLVCALLFIKIHTNRRKSFEYKIKPKVMPLLCNYFDNLIWTRNTDNLKSLSEISKLSISKIFNFTKIDDAFKGIHNGLPFEIIETSEQYKTVYGIKVTKALILSFKINKSSDSYTLIKPPGSFFSLDIRDFITTHSLNKIKLEDIKFEKEFDVYSNDEVEARYLVTPAFMARLKFLSLVYSSNYSRFHSCTFCNGYCYIVFTSYMSDFFCLCNPGYKLYDIEPYYNMFCEIIPVYDMIDYFKLTEKTGI